MVVAAQRVSEPLGHGRVVALLPERYDHELSVLRPAHVHQVAAVRVADQNSPAVAGLHPSRGAALRDSRSDLRLCIERPAYALAKPLGGVIGDRDKQSTAGP
jgi:hypothetical protein